MPKKIVKYLKDNKGDLYIEALICLIGVVVIFSFLFQASNAMIEKMYIDNKLTNISKIVSMNGGWIDPYTGEKSTDIENIENEVIAKLGGGEFVYDCNPDDPDTTERYTSGPDKYSYGPYGFVQIGDAVVISFHYPDYEVLNVVDDKIEAKIDIDISKTAVGEIYHKGLY